VKVSTIALCLLMSGCATCERHPLACSAAAVIVGTSIALSVRGHSDPAHPFPQVRVK
jgi:hypothetical protein